MRLYLPTGVLVAAALAAVSATAAFMLILGARCQVIYAHALYVFVLQSVWKILPDSKVEKIF